MLSGLPTGFGSSGPSRSDPVCFDPLKEDSILFQELLPIVFACAVWGSSWQRSSVRVSCDNEGALSVVNSGYSKVMHLLRSLFYQGQI